ncbi:UNVERIFIED_CONTAM: hypothetical protein K2H54_031885 [Gekko kuhli]
MFECPGLKPGDGGRFRFCEKTNLLFVEFNTVSCSSRSNMEAAGPWTGKGYSAPWMYHRVAGQYTLLQKHLVSDFSPGQRRPSPRVLQDSTNWHDAQPPPPPWGPLRQEGPWFAGKEPKRAAASPKPRSPRSPTYDGFAALCRRELAWGAAAHRDPAAPDCSKGPAGAPSKLRGDLPARSPPSYEAHMLLRAGQGPRKENWPRPPPYVAPPAYEAAHRTVRPQQPRAPRRAASAAGGPAIPAEAPPGRLGGPPRTPSSGRRGGQGQAAPVPGGPWSYLVGARTWGGRRRQPERAPEASSSSSGWAPDWPRTPPPRSHTLPRVTKRLPAPSAPVPNHGSVPQHALPAGWAFSHAAAGKGSPAWGEPRRSVSSSRLREPGGSPAAAGSRGTPRRAGGLLVIDATCVVIQTHYIPPARTERVRYVGRAGAKQSPTAAPPPPSPASGSLEERASRILGLPLSELGFTEQGGQPSGIASPGRRAEGRCPAEAVAAAGAASALARPERAPSSAQGSPKQPFPTPAPEGVLAEPSGTGLSGLQAGRMASAGQSGDGCAPPAEAEPSRSPQHRSYVRDLREAMSRIRRHTAPDSDTDEELEKERRPAGGQFSWKGRLNEGALSYSSSSSESIGSNATVVPGNAKSPTLSNGPKRGWQLSQVVP